MSLMHSSSAPLHGCFPAAMAGSLFQRAITAVSGRSKSPGASATAAATAEILADAAFQRHGRWDCRVAAAGLTADAVAAAAPAPRVVPPRYVASCR